MFNTKFGNRIEMYDEDPCICFVFVFMNLIFFKFVVVVVENILCSYPKVSCKSHANIL